MTSAAAGRPDTDVVISLCPDGPMLVRGPLTILDADGTEIPRNRRTVALCRCGRSALAPFCDGSHKMVRRIGTPDAERTGRPQR